jgi:hypothetical protein
MNCSQLLERRATTNWERATPSLRDRRENMIELQSAPRPWGLSRSAGSSPADRIFAQKPAFPTRWS